MFKPHFNARGELIVPIHLSSPPLVPAAQRLPERYDPMHSQQQRMAVQICMRFGCGAVLLPSRGEIGANANQSGLCNRCAQQMGINRAGSMMSRPEPSWGVQSGPRKKRRVSAPIDKVPVSTLRRPPQPIAPLGRSPNEGVSEPLRDQDLQGMQIPLAPGPSVPHKQRRQVSHNVLSRPPGLPISPHIHPPTDPPEPRSASKRQCERCGQGLLPNRHAGRCLSCVSAQFKVFMRRIEKSPEPVPSPPPVVPIERAPSSDTTSATSKTSLKICIKRPKASNALPAVATSSSLLSAPTPVPQEVAPAVGVELPDQRSTTAFGTEPRGGTPLQAVEREDPMQASDTNPVPETEAEHSTHKPSVCEAASTALSTPASPPPTNQVPDLVDGGLSDLSNLTDLSATDDESDEDEDDSESEESDDGSVSSAQLTGLKIRLPAKIYFDVAKQLKSQPAPSLDPSRRCSFRKCPNLLPPVQDHRWKICERCREDQRLYQRARLGRNGRKMISPRILSNSDDEATDLTSQSDSIGLGQAASMLLEDEESPMVPESTDGQPMEGVETLDQVEMATQMMDQDPDQTPLELEYPPETNDTVEPDGRDPSSSPELPLRSIRPPKVRRQTRVASYPHPSSIHQGPVIRTNYPPYGHAEQFILLFKAQLLDFLQAQALYMSYHYKREKEAVNAPTPIPAIELPSANVQEGAREPEAQTGNDPQASSLQAEALQIPNTGTEAEPTVKGGADSADSANVHSERSPVLTPISPDLLSPRALDPSPQAPSGHPSANLPSSSSPGSPTLSSSVPSSSATSTSSASNSVPCTTSPKPRRKRSFMDAAEFGFDGEFSIVAPEFTLKNPTQEQEVEKYISELKTTVQEQTGVMFEKSVRAPILEFEGLINRFRCNHEVAVFMAPPDAEGRQPCARKVMTGELEIAVLVDRSHPLLCGRKTVVRFRLKG